MLNNVEHLAWVHYEIANKPFPEIGEDWLNKLHSLLVVIIFEIVVITFVRSGQKGFSIFFTFCIWILSMIYYKAPDLFFQESWQNLTAATVYSTIFTISIYMFSEMLAEWYQDENKEKILCTRINELQAELKQSQANCTTFQSELDKWSAGYNELHKDMEELESENVKLRRQLTEYQKAEEAARESLRCPHCRDFIADTEGQLRSHKGHCPNNPKSNQKQATE